MLVIVIVTVAAVASGACSTYTFIPLSNTHG